MDVKDILKFVLFLVIFNKISGSNKFPKCYRNDSKINECVWNVTKLLENQNILELNLPKLDPLFIPTLRLEQKTKFVNYKAMFKNLTLNGLSNYKINKLDYFDNNITIEGDVGFEELNIEANYFITGQMFNTSIHGMGVFEGNFSNINSSFILQGFLLKKNNKEYYKNTETLVKIHVLDANIEFENLFNGDEDLGKKTNNFIRENIRKILNEISPALESAIQMFLEDVIENISNKFTLDKIVQ